MKRRTLLLGTAGAAAGSLLTSCRPSTRSDWRVKLLDGSVPAQVLREFSRQHRDAQPTFTREAQILDLFEQLQNWQRSPQSLPSPWRQLLPWRQTAPTPVPAALVTLGDYWLKPAIEQGLIQPIELTSSTWQNLSPHWRQLVQRDTQGLLSESGPVWGAPYRLQGLAIAYRSAPFLNLEWRPQRWSDLLRPALQQRIALPDHPRVAIGLAQKILGQSINGSLSPSLSEVREQLEVLHQQVKVYDSQTYLKALVNEDIWVAVGWSSDILAAMTRYSNIEAFIPTEGTLLAADVWVQPTQTSAAEHTALNQEWIDFCWQRPVATQISLSSHGISPIFIEASDTNSADTLPNLLKNQPLLIDAQIALQSELIQPLSAEVQAEYWQLWRQTRSAA